MFGGEALGTLVVLLALSVATRETPLFLLTLALLMAALLSRVWEQYCLVRVEYGRRLSRRHACYGEDVELEIEVVNRKLLPLSWLEVEDEIPHDLPPAQGRIVPSHKPTRSILACLLALRPYERVRRRYTIRCTARGEHVFGPVLLRSGDLFGFAVREEQFKLVDTLVVYPRVVPLTQLGLPARHPLGDLKAHSWLFEDVSRTAGAREYRPEDGLRRIHWPASARTQQLQARVYDATTRHSLALFLNVATNEGAWWGYDYDSDVLEMSITTAASIASWGLEQGYQVGLYTNGLHRGGKGPVVVEHGRGTGQLERILLALGRLEPLVAKRFQELLSREARRLPFGATVVVVTAGMTPPVAAAILALRARGHAVVPILTGRRETAASLNGIAVRRVGPPESWRDMPALSVVGGAQGN